MCAASLTGTFKPSAEEVAKEFLGDNEQTVMNEIADAVEWFPIEVGRRLGIGG